uniref:Thyroglobulin type-1 domain-containing protein n=1 Tax=Panagrolaimus sp. JU765 TaxID=591449 RepID=A0AC34RMT6_9BILA
MQTVVFVFFASFIIFSFAERICERQKTCRRCDAKGRYSYYSCDSDEDCFKEESCREGFCCPAINATFFEDPANRPFSSSFFDESAVSLSACPDGSSWMRLCKTDLDCLFDDEICAHGKCCSSCISRRRQLLREHSPQALAGIHIPQCSEDGRFYQMKQCIHAFPMECFCSSLYGERVNPVAIDENGVLCSNSIQPEAPTPFADPRLQQQPPNRFLSIEKGAFHEFNPSTNCMDPMKEFRPCRTACQVTCDTRTRPICPFAGRCNPGCQCRMPYILVSSDDLDNSRCVLPAECPMNSRPVPTPGRVVYKAPALPFNAQESSDASLFRQFPHGAIGVGIDRSKQMHCSDPLKNFLTCGTSCPAACDRLNPVCSFQCVSGCFCRTPYVLSDMNDANSACILPQHCEIHPKKNPFEPETTTGKDEEKGFFLQTTTMNPENETNTATTSEATTTSEVVSTAS